MSRDPWYVTDSDLSRAWSRTFLEAMEVGRGELAPMVVVLTGFTGGLPTETTGIREALDDKLGQLKLRSTATTANTIFPTGVWARSGDREELYQRYENILPRLHRDRSNNYGTYFERLTSWGANTGDKATVNQMEKIFSAFDAGVRRRTAFQASLFDPRRDLTNQRQRGFPCLEHVAFGPDGDGGLEVSAFYTTQYIVDRAYGNYLGLARLGGFVAEQFDLELTKVTCFASVGQLGGMSKTSLNDLAAAVSGEIE